MCLIFFKPAGNTIPDHYFTTTHKVNGDGMGIALVENGKLRVERGLFNLESFIKFIKTNEDKELLIHFRNASPGMEISEEMSHPFTVESVNHRMEGKGKPPRYTFAIAHNGRIKDWRSSQKQSDTFCFIEDVIEPLLHDDPCAFDKKYLVKIIEKLIDDDNKMVIYRYDALEDKAKVYILNKTGGWGMHTDGYSKVAHTGKDGTWYSNESYLPPVLKPVVTHGYAGWDDDMYGGGGHGKVKVTHYPPKSTHMTPPATQTTPAGKLPGVVQLMKDYEIKTDKDKTDKGFASTWSKPDEAGWKWCFLNDYWINIKTGAIVNKLASRPHRPRYMDRWERDENMQKAKAIQAESAAVKTVDPDTMSTDEWNAYVVQLNLEKEMAKAADAAEVDPSIVSLAHFPKEDRRILRKACSDYVKDHMVGVNTKGITNDVMIALVREEIKGFVEVLTHSTDFSIDSWIIANAKRGLGVADGIEEYGQSVIKTERAHGNN